MVAAVDGGVLLGVPNSAALLGVPVYAQGLLYDPTPGAQRVVGLADALPEIVRGVLPLATGLQICSDLQRPTVCHLLGARGVELIVGPRATPPENYERWKIPSKSRGHNQV